MSDADHLSFPRPLRKPSGDLDFANLAILVLDDSIHFGRLIQQILRGFGVQAISITADPAEAMTLLATNRYHLVIADFLLGPHLGSDFVGRIRAAEDEPYQEVPVIMVSGHTDAENVRRMRDCGATEILAKPISPASLLERMERAFAAPRPFVKEDVYKGPDRRRRSGDFEGDERRTRPPRTAKPRISKGNQKVKK